MIIRFW